MEKIYKRCLVISLLMCASFCITLVVADIHEGTGDLTGLSLSCGTCEEGGSDCEDPVEETCYMDDYWNKVGDDCAAPCSGTDGEYCDQDENAGGMCRDDSVECTDTEQAPCVQRFPVGGVSYWECDNDDKDPYDCGTRNTCPTTEE